jgi:hypothetical protein
MPENISQLHASSAEVVNNRSLELMKSPFKIYEWEFEYRIQGKRRVRSPIISHLINMNTVVSNAFVVPCHSLKTKLSSTGNPKYSDKFWYVESRFFDRSGWDTVTMVDPDDYIIPGVPDIIEENFRIGTNIDSDTNSSNSDNEYTDSDSD